MNVFYSSILELAFFSTVRAQFIIYIKSFPYYSVSKRMIILYVLPLPRASTILFTPSSAISTYTIDTRPQRRFFKSSKAKRFLKKISEDREDTQKISSFQSEESSTEKLIFRKIS